MFGVLCYLRGLWVRCGVAHALAQAVPVPPAFLQQGPVLLARPEDREPAGRGGGAPGAQPSLAMMLEGLSCFGSEEGLLCSVCWMRVQHTGAKAELSPVGSSAAVFAPQLVTSTCFGLLR